MGASFGGFGSWAGFASLLIMVVFAFIMPSKTKEGAEFEENVKGFILYLKTAEVDRIKFHDAPEKNPQTFEKYLPYAMVLGLVDEWSGKFEGIVQRPPEWYHGANLNQAFSASLFANSLNSFSSTTNNSFVSSMPHTSASSGISGFGGGGSSSGGFGGGGGGSW